MGIGDEIIASGHALAEYRRTGKRIRIVDRLGRPRWSEMWRGVPYIVAPGESGGDAIDVRNGPGCRPYIAYPWPKGSQCRYSGWAAGDHPGEICLTAEERAFAAVAAPERFVLIEPHLKPGASENKQWGWTRWQALAGLLQSQGLAVRQVGPAGTRTLDGAALIETSDFRRAAAVLARATLSVLPEGGLHHAAGALRRPAVVLRAGVPSVEATGYRWHLNIAAPQTCGMQRPCQHCIAFWAELKPEAVMIAAMDML